MTKVKFDGEAGVEFRTGETDTLFAEPGAFAIEGVAAPGTGTKVESTCQCEPWWKPLRAEFRGLEPLAARTDAASVVSAQIEKAAPGQLRTAARAFAAGALDREELTADDNAQLDAILELSSGELGVNFKDYAPKALEAWDTVRGKAVTFVNASRADEVVALSTGDQIRTPAIRQEVVRRRVQEMGLELCWAVDALEQKIVAMFEKELDAATAQVNALRQALADPTLSGAIQSLAALAAFNIRKDKNKEQGLDTGSENTFEIAIRRRCLVLELPLVLGDFKSTVATLIALEEKAGR